MKNEKKATFLIVFILFVFGIMLLIMRKNSLYPNPEWIEKLINFDYSNLITVILIGSVFLVVIAITSCNFRNIKKCDETMRRTSIQK